MIRELLRQSLIEGGVFHVDNHAPHFLVRDQFSEAIGFLLRGQRADRDVPRPIGQDDEKRLHIGMRVLLVLEHVRGEQQPCGERSLPSYGDINQRSLRQLDRVGGRQHQRGAVLLEDDQTDAVAALICIRQQGQDCALRGVHPLRNGHGPGGVHHEQDEVRHALDADLALQVALLDGEGETLAFFGALFLERRGGAEGGVEGDVVEFVARGARLDIPSVFAFGLGEGASSRVLAG